MKKICPLCEIYFTKSMCICKIYLPLHHQTETQMTTAQVIEKMKTHDAINTGTGQWWALKGNLVARISADDWDKIKDLKKKGTLKKN